MVHLLPHALEAEARLGIDYSVAPSILLAGYYFIFFIERVITSHSHELPTTDSQRQGHQHALSHTQNTLNPHVSTAGCEPAPVPVDIADSTRRDGEDAIAVTFPGDQDKSKYLGSIHVHHVSSASLVVFLFVLGVHQVLEALVVGVSTSAKTVLLLFTAVAVHKLPTHMALTTRFIRAGFETKRILWWLLPYTLVAPVSVLIGLGLAEAES